MNALMAEKTIKSDVKKYFETAKATIKKHLSLAISVGHENCGKLL